MTEFSRWLIAISISLALSTLMFGFAQGFLCPKGTAP